MEEFVLERIEENETLFTKEEKCYIYNNIKLIKKIYILVLLNALQAYE